MSKDPNELTEAELAEMSPNDRAWYERILAQEARDAAEAANEVPVVFTREQAESIIAALHIAQDEMPWSEFDAAWQDVAAIVQAAMRAKGMG